MKQSLINHQIVCPKESLCCQSNHFELLARLHVHDPSLINIAPNVEYVFIFQVY